MSIETTLTLVVAAAILAAALSLRLLAGAILRAVGSLTGTRPGHRDVIEDALPSVPLRARLRSFMTESFQALQEIDWSRFLEREPPSSEDALSIGFVAATPVMTTGLDARGFERASSHRRRSA